MKLPRLLRRRELIYRMGIGASAAAGTAALPASQLAAQESSGVSADWTPDPDQGPITAAGERLRRYVSRENAGPDTVVAAAIAEFESRFRKRTVTGYVRRKNLSAAELRTTGDSDATFLQAIADFNALWQGGLDVPAGIFQIDNPVFVTHGLAFPWSTGRFIGAGLNFDGSVAFRGTTIVAARTDRPALICQGGRKDRIADLTLKGGLREHIFAAGLGTASSQLDDTDPRAWDAGGIGDRRWAPYAGIAVDPFASGKPPVAYPTIAPPPYLGAVTQTYGREVSSDVLIERVLVTGFNVALVVHPAQGVAQGDYVHAQDLTIEACKYGISIGNTQSRLPTGVHRHIARVFCGFTNRHHGAQAGFFGGTETSAEVGSCIKVFDFDLSYLGLLTFSGLYTEACWQLGDVRGGTAIDGSIRISGAHLNMSYPSGDYVPRRGVPKYILGDPTRATGYTGTGQVAVESTVITHRTVCPLMVGNLSLDRVQLYSLDASTRAKGHAQAIAHNGSMGLVMPPGVRPAPAIVSAPRFDLASGQPTAAHTTDGNFRETDRNSLIPWFVAKARPKSHNDDRWAVDVPLWQHAVAAQNFALVSQAGLDVVLSDATSQDTANNRAQGVGCLVLHDLDGRWYFIKERAYANRTVTLRALTDFHDVGGGDVMRTPYSSSGTLHFFETRFYTPPVVLVGKVVAGRDTITDVTSLPPPAALASSAIEAGDYLWTDPFADTPFGPGTNRIVKVDTSSASLTMSGPAARSDPRFRLGLLIRSA